MTKTQIGLGVLSIPMSFDILGLIPGMFTLCFIGVITGWSNYMVGVFKQNHPDVYTIDDAGFKMFGRYGREFFAVSFMLSMLSLPPFVTTLTLLDWIFISGSAMLGISIAFNAVSRHAACTAVFVAIAALLTFAFASIRTLGKIGWLAWIGLVCIMTAIFTVTIAVTLEDQPAVARSLGVVDWEPDWKLFGNPSVQQAFSAVGCQVFAFAGTPAFFSIVAEMRDPGLYTRALICSQSVVATVYIIIGCIVYIYCGSYVASPALGSAGPLIKKICYGFALPGLLVTAMIVTHVSLPPIYYSRL
jgi:amino acid permease